VVNQKGGCGKTTTAVNVAACLAFLGKKVLIIDMDSQAHSTLSLGINPDMLEKSMFDVLDPDNEVILLRDVIIEIEDGLDLAPSQTILSVIEQKLSGIAGRERRLQLALAPLKDVYDFVFIDCPPSIGLLTFNALCAADEVIVPVEPSYLAVHGLKKLLETIALVNERAEREISVKALITLLDNRTAYAQKMEAEIRDMFQGQVFESPVRKNVKLQEAAERGRSIVQFNRHSSGFDDYISVSMEILDLHFEEEDNEAEPDIIKSYVIRTSEVPVEQNARPAVTFDEDYPTEEIALNEHILFSIEAPEANTVELAADFSGWTRIPMRKSKEQSGMWELEVALKPGVYEYKFVIDGIWKADPDNFDTVDDMRGGVNSLVSFMPYVTA